MTERLWTGDMLKELLRRGARGERFGDIARDYGGKESLAVLRWTEHSSPELKKMRREALAFLTSRRQLGAPVYIEAPKADPFSGQCFRDDPKAIADKGSPWPGYHAAPGGRSSLGWAA